MSMWQCPERTWSRCSNKEVSHTKWNTYINIGKRWMYILNWRIISVSKAFLSCTQAFSRTRTQTSPKRPTRWKRRCRPPVRPLTSPGIPTRFAGPLFHAWIQTLWPFLVGHPSSCTRYPLVFCWRSRTSTSVPDVAKCSGMAHTLAGSFPCFRTSFT